jgi:cyclopropane-fatty-acyl-phospholipid synthase
MSVVEIGSGWGALACYLAKTCGVTVTAINVSPEQIASAKERAKAEGVADRVTFVETDYRELTGKFDRLVSVGMMEHVGVAYFDDYFSTVKRLLKPGGFAMIHAIGRMSPPGSTAPFIRKYIFPGGYVPALSEVFASTERSGLWVADAEVLRLHYYWTIKHWRERFAAERAAVVEMKGERFARMWEFYLAAVELGFLHGSNMVFQLLLAEKRDAVPVQRDYITDAERALAGKGG